MIDKCVIIRLKIILTFFIFILCSFHSAFSQVKITINDVSIQRGKIYEIPVYGSISGSQLNDLKLVFSFDSRIIDIKGAKGGAFYAIKTLEPDFSLTFPRLDSSIIQISSSDIQSVTDGIICYLEVEGLVYSDSLATLQLRDLLLNGSQVTTLTYKEGTIKVLGEAFLSHFPDYLGSCTPNPITNGVAKFDFSIENSGKVHFLIYSVLGRLVMTSDENEMDQFVVLNPLNKKLYNNFNSTFDKGNYELTFQPLPWIFAQGLYFMVMRTEKGAYKTNFLYFKQ